MRSQSPELCHFFRAKNKTIHLDHRADPPWPRTANVLQMGNEALIGKSEVTGNTFKH